MALISIENSVWLLILSRDDRSYFLFPKTLPSFIKYIQDSNEKTLITGITGQDDSYMAEFLFNKRYDEALFQAPGFLIQHTAHRSSLTGFALRLQKLDPVI